MITSMELHSMNIKHKNNWPYIPDKPYKILIIGGSGCRKTNEFNRKPTRH